MAEDIDRLMKHAHRIEREGKKEIAEVVYAAASEIARMRAEIAWQPIESAPKDGTKIWAFLNYGDTGEEMAVIAWTGDPRWPWRLNGDGASDRVAPHIPTHWMPLPPSPTGAKDNG